MAAEQKTHTELSAGLPKDNLTILDLARQMGKAIQRDPVPAGSVQESWANGQRAKLKDVVRYKPVEIPQIWTIAMAKHRDIQSVSYWFGMSNQLSAEGMWLRSIQESSDNAPVTIVLNDDGIEASTDVVTHHYAREQRRGVGSGFDVHG